ncbi:tryptophan synthase beta subunit-like PLP-dependent enzyme [Multifurca ochricompacta]|uniref:L-serine ammonia-lyase n=1 Tax=Multifurca ochricompacta TaxID=376703 RepID=A0AAD4M7B8_9AGAM|nr:tryptophan synthase beta subunit-like PLP-dependent enzyme [Multifurca ochricompacta]
MSWDSEHHSHLWTETPLIYSDHLSRRLGQEQYAVYLKLENLQPSHSYKYRGISHFIQRTLAEHGPTLRVICASGGNAGLAAAYAARELGVSCTIFLPDSVEGSTHTFLRDLGASVVCAGRFYLESLRAAELTVQADPNAVLVPAYDHPTLWQGHASMIVEIQTQLPRSIKPGAVFCSVGGGGLLGGIIEGCRDAGWDDVPIIALETHGSACFYHSIAANRTPNDDAKSGVTIQMNDTHGVRIAHVTELRSKATSLGASEPSAGVVRAALDRSGDMKCVTVPDEMAMHVAGAFADDHKFLVELACSTTLTPAYQHELLARLVPPNPAEKKVLVFIVCGGFKISRQDLAEYSQIVREDQNVGGKWDLVVDGEQLQVDKGILQVL